MSKEPINYALTPLSDIDPEARKIAVAWVDGFEKIVGIEIQQKHKLASDIMNYSQSQLSEYKQKLKAEIEKEEYQIPNDDFEFGWNKALEKVVLTLIDKI